MLSEEVCGHHMRMCTCVLQHPEVTVVRGGHQVFGCLMRRKGRGGEGSVTLPRPGLQVPLPRLKTVCALPCHRGLYAVPP